MALRKSLKSAASRIGRRLFGRDEPDREPPVARASSGVDLSRVPKIVDGSGDTPGPNHKSDIGRTWVAAQLAGGVGIQVLDIRSPSEWAQGHLPEAVLIPGAVLDEALDLVPGRGTPLVLAVCDAIGGEGASAVAARLRSEGWPGARRLVGGFAEWIEEGEPVDVPDGRRARYPVGTTVRVRGLDGGAVVWRVEESAGATRYDVWVAGSAVCRRACAEAELST